MVVLCAFTLMFVGFGAAYDAVGSYSAPILGAAAFAFVAALGIRGLLRVPAPRAAGA